MARKGLAMVVPVCRRWQHFLAICVFRVMLPLLLPLLLMLLLLLKLLVLKLLLLLLLLPLPLLETASLRNVLPPQPPMMAMVVSATMMLTAMAI